MSEHSSASQPDDDVVPAGVRAQRVSFMNIVADVWRHALPLLSLYLLKGNIAGYLLLTVLDLDVDFMGHLDRFLVPGAGDEVTVRPGTG